MDKGLSKPQWERRSSRQGASSTRSKSTWLAISLALSIALAGGVIYSNFDGNVKLNLKGLRSRCGNGTNNADKYAVCSSPEGQSAAIYTVDQNNSRVACLVVQGSEVLQTFTSLEDFNGWNTRNVAVKYLDPGEVVLPGITDSHVHTLEYGYKRLLPLESGRSIEEVVSLVRDYILTNPEFESNKSKVVEGWGWDKTVWEVEEYPTAADLDADPIISGRQVMLRSKDGHSSWVSQSTIDANAPYPDKVEGGVILRNDDGSPTGIFQDEAQRLIRAPDLSDEDLLKRFNITADDALKYGVTSVHDAGSQPVPLAFFERLAAKQVLPIRMYAMRYFNETWDYPPPSPPSTYPASRLVNRSIKIIGDGSLRSGGAYLFEPYSDDPDTSGFMRFTPEVLKAKIPQFLKDGWQVNVHAIGDKANSIVLDAFEIAVSDIGEEGLKERRPRIEHAQIMREVDIERMGNLGVIASIQPTHCTDDMWYGEDRLGPDRVRELYAFRSMLDAGSLITTGSDIPVEGINPLEGFFAAITRIDKEGNSPHGSGGWFPEQKLTRLEALRGMTINPAYASFSEEILGSLEAGKRADFVILSGDIMEIPEKDILNVTVKATVLDGEVVFGSF
ncbi:hypothetical protein PQX77_019666 [Marasmius sp. AFHP31]|nr:hypothetical protein PQX77_019666 [Marasmius sp. AFHP31]